MAAGMQGAVLVTVKKASNLPASDSNGLSDPYVRMVLDDHKRHTTVQRRTLNPSWNEKFEWLEARLALNLHCTVNIQRSFLTGVICVGTGHAAQSLPSSAALGSLPLYSKSAWIVSSS
jgi:hypothetical protein